MTLQISVRIHIPFVATNDPCKPEQGFLGRGSTST